MFCLTREKKKSLLSLAYFLLKFWTHNFVFLRHFFFNQSFVFFVFIISDKIEWKKKKQIWKTLNKIELKPLVIYVRRNNLLGDLVLMSYRL